MIDTPATHYHILVIEDNPLDAELVQERLRAAGFSFDIVVADSRAEFERHFSSGNFDLILADYALPDFDGLSALDIVRSRDPHLPFIFVSGVLGEEIAVETLLRGATDYVLKQKLDRLAPAVNRALSEYAAYRSRERTELELRRVEERFETLTNSLPAMVWTCDREGNLTYTNSLWDRCIGSATHWLARDHLHPDDYEHCLHVWREAVAHAKPFEIDCRFSIDGSTSFHWHVVRATPLGSSEEWVGTCIDVQQQRARDAELKTAERLALIGRMSSVIAHEINNPLEALTNILYLMRSEESSAARVKSYLADAEQELLRISAITKQTLMWTREESGSAEVPAHTLIDEPLKLFSGKLRNKDIHLHKDYNGAPHVRVVPGEMRQVFANLISNAIDAVQPDGNIKVAIEERGNTVVLSIEDDGHGIAESRLETLFRPFQSSKGNLGNGLGLYVSKGIVDRNGGNIEIRSALNKGTYVSVTLPRLGS